jgi:hypothetical protein
MKANGKGPDAVKKDRIRPIVLGLSRRIAECHHALDPKAPTLDLRLRVQ